LELINNKLENNYNDIKDKITDYHLRSSSNNNKLSISNDSNILYKILIDSWPCPNKII